jgi:FtsH-binding integral membrane protein
MDSSQILTENKKASSKFLAVVFGYMFIGLAITALVGFAFSWFMASRYGDGAGYLTDAGVTIVAITGIVAMIVAFIDSFVILFTSLRSGKAPWVGYLIYALCVGFGFSLILLVPGMELNVVGEAFGITAGCFGIMFLIGYFSPVDLSPLAFVAIALLIGLFLSSLIFGICWLAIPSAQAYLAYDYWTTVIIIIITMLITGWDANNMSRWVEKGATNQNIALYCAFNLYSDFISLFIRILYFLLLAKNRS